MNSPTHMARLHTPYHLPMWLIRFSYPNCSLQFLHLAILVNKDIIGIMISSSPATNFPAHAMLSIKIWGIYSSYSTTLTIIHFMLSNPLTKYDSYILCSMVIILHSPNQNALVISSLFTNQCSNICAW